MFFTVTNNHKLAPHSLRQGRAPELKKFRSDWAELEDGHTGCEPRQLPGSLVEDVEGAWLGGTLWEICSMYAIGASKEGKRSNESNHILIILSPPVGVFLQFLLGVSSPNPCDLRLGGIKKSNPPSLPAARVTSSWQDLMAPRHRNHTP